MAAYDLYAIDAETLEAAKAVTTSVISLGFHPHNSSYIGDYYRAHGEGEETFKLRENLDPLDGEPAEMDYPGHRFLLYVDRSHRSNALRVSLLLQPRIELLRHEDL